MHGMLNTTFATFFPAQMGPNIMVEVACEPRGNCNVDQQSFKAYLSRWLAVTAQLVPTHYERIFSYLRVSAMGAAGQCSGGSRGRTCGRMWNSTTWDGTYGVGEQMSALAVVQAMLIHTADLAAPVGATSGGTSKGNPTAGTGTTGKAGLPSVNTRIITTGDRAGAGIVTAVVLMFLLGGGCWMALE